uniref:Aryl-hydrocarbon-interacting protein-like 1 n=1 Tax=Stegastes partitus TaxID=144197 RepID=A0A3B4ZSG3_9TELE
MEDTYLLNHPGVKKKILAGGTGPLPHFPPGTKLVFNFQTLLDDFERTVIDDSRLAGRPAEIFVGKMFKMEVWETLLMSMRIGEVAEFWCDAVQHTGLYPIVSKGMRLIAQGKDPLEGQRHMCGMGNMFHYHSTGFPELDELMRTPQPLIFVMELLQQVGDPLSYHRESWMMEKDEKLQTVPSLHMQGNALVKQRQFREAASKYKEAVLLLKTVQSREMPGDVDYINLGRMIVPLELNYCQCMLELEEYYEVIEKTTELLDKHKCVKGYYKRAKAHAAVWNEKEARKDFNMVAHLDVTLASLVGRELKALSERMREKYWEEKDKYWNMLEKKENKSDEEEEKEEEGHDDEEKEETEKGKEDLETTESKVKVGEENGSKESPIKCAEVQKEELGENNVTPTEGTCVIEEADTSVNLSTCNDKTEGKDWQQMLRLVMLLQDEGNFLIKEKSFEEASEKFKEAIEYVDLLQNKQVDKCGDDWESLEKVRRPLVLNLSHCLLELKQYQEVVKLNNELLKKHKNFKAVYQRARAHAALCNEDEARRDFDMVEKLDPKFKPFVRQELKMLGERIRTLHTRQNKTYRDATQEKWGPGGSKAKGAARKKKSAQKTTAEANK